MQAFDERSRYEDLGDDTDFIIGTDTSGGLGDPWYDDPTLNVPVDVPFNTNANLPDISTLPQPAPTGGGGFDNLLVSITNTALAAIRINQAWKQSKDPNIRTATISGGFTKTPNSDGYLTVTDSAGRVVGREKPATGTPYALASGQTIINNGDGTYALITPGGITSNRRYPDSTGGGSGFSMGDAGSALPLLIGAGILGVYFLAQSRGRR